MPKFKVVIDYSKCSRCGLCVRICPTSVFEMEDVVRVVREENCLACLACEILCPKKIITITPIVEKSKLIDERYGTLKLP